MIEIPLTQGQVAIVDDCDADLSELKWFAQYYPKSDSYYAGRNKRANVRRQTMVLLHRVILSRILGKELESHELVDHENLNTLDNRRENLRLATFSNNQHNRIRYNTNKSGYKGVHWYKAGNKWAAQIQVSKEKIFLGYFDNIEDAAEAYRIAAMKYHGEFARWTEKQR